MKKVFSVKNYEEDMSRYLTKREIKLAKELWANGCDGLTVEEIEEKYGYYLIDDDWMIVVED